MKLSLCRPLILIPFVAAPLLAFPALGAVTSYDVFKIQYWQQNSGLEPSLDTFRAVSRVFVEDQNEFVSGQLNRPNGLPQVELQLNTTTYASPVWLADTDFASGFDMEGEYPDGGDYTFSLDSGGGPPSDFVLPLPAGGLFPDTIPAFSESTRNALLAGPSAGSDLELGFNSFADLTESNLGISSLFDVRVYTTVGVQLAYWSGLQSQGANSVLVPGGTLAPGTSYFAQISFLNSDRFPDEGGVPSGFASYNITTTQSFLTAVPEPAETALGIGLLLLGWRLWARRPRHVS